MCFRVLRKVIASHKTLATDPTDIPFLARMCAVMTGELVGASKLFFATYPSAVKWTFSRVRAKVRFQVATLAVLFITTRVLTDVNFLLLLALSPCVSSPGFLFWFRDQFTGLRGRVVVIASRNASTVLRGYI